MVSFLPLPSLSNLLLSLFILSHAFQAQVQQIKWCNILFPFFANTLQEEKKQLVSRNKLSYAIGFPISWGRGTAFRQKLKQLHILDVGEICALSRKLEYVSF